MKIILEDKRGNRVDGDAQQGERQVRVDVGSVEDIYEHAATENGVRVFRHVSTEKKPA